MSYFGSIYFNMPNGLVCGLKNVIDDGKIIRGSSMELDRQAELSFIPLKNIKNIYNVIDNHSNFNIYEYENGQTDNIPYKDLKAYMKPKRNATIIETYDNKYWCWGNGEYIGQKISEWDSKQQKLVEKAIYLDEPTNFTNLNYDMIKNIYTSKRTSNVFNGTFIINKNDNEAKPMGYGNIGYGFNSYNRPNLTYTERKKFCNVKKVFITRDCLFFLYLDGSLKVFCVDNTYGQSGVGDKNTTYEWKTVNINTDHLVDICDYIQKIDYKKDKKNLLQGKATTLFIYDNGDVLGCGANFQTLNENGVEIKCFDNKYLTDECSIKPVRTNLHNVLKYQNEIILYKNNLTNNKIINESSMNYVKDFNSYCSPCAWGIYFLDKYDNLKCLLYADDKKALNYYTNKRDYIKENNSSYKIIDFNNLYNVRTWTIKDNTKTEFRMELYKNSEEYLCDIPKECVEKIEYKLGLDINNFDLTIPKYINGSNEINPLYNLIKSRMQVIITDINNVKSRYILKEGSGIFTKQNGSKSFKAYSVEKVIMNNTVQVSEGYYTLNKDNDNEDKGIINTIMEDTIYDVGCVDIEAKNRELIGYNTKNIEIVKPSDLLNATKQTSFNCIKEDVKYGDVLYNYFDARTLTSHQMQESEKNRYIIGTQEQIVDIDDNTNTYGDNPTYLTLIYNNVVSGEIDINADNSYTISNEVNYGNQIIKIEKPITHALINIKAIVCNEVGKRNSIKHIITYDAVLDGKYTHTPYPVYNPVTFEQTDNFVKCATDSSVTNIKKYITWDSITLQYTKGEKTTIVDTVEFKYEDKEQSIDSFLTDISDTFTTTFEFDTMNNFLHCFDGELKNLTNEVGFTLGQTKIGDMALGGENAINNSKIINKLNSDTNVELTYDDITKIESKESDDNILSGMRIKGKDDVSINNYNPLGGNVIENWDYFINNKLISESCLQHLNNYLSAIENKQDEWNGIQNKYNEINETIISKEGTITVLKVRIQELNALIGTMMGETDSSKIEEYRRTLSVSSENYDIFVKELENLKKQKEKIEEELLDFSSIIKKDKIIDVEGNKIFTYSDIQELAYLNNIEEVNDDYFTDEKQLYEYYKKQLEYKVKGLVEFTTTTNNMMRYYMYGGNLIKLGNIYELDDDLKEVFKTNRVKLLQYNYYPNKYENGSIEDLVFSNKEKVVDELKLYRKNTQIKTLNNEKAINNLTSKVIELENKLAEKQNAQYQQTLMNDKLLEGRMIDGKQIKLSLTNIYCYSKDNPDSQETDFIKFNNIEDCIRQYKSIYNKYLSGDTVYNKENDKITNKFYFEVNFKDGYKTIDEYIDNITSLTIKYVVYVNEDSNICPTIDGSVSFDGVKFNKMPYNQLESTNFEGVLPVKTETNFETTEHGIEFIYKWNRLNGEPLPTNDIYLNYNIFNYKNNPKIQRQIIMD